MQMSKKKTCDGHPSVTWGESSASPDCSNALVMPGHEWIVELEFGVYIAPIESDPGRTVERGNAKRFSTHIAAKRALRMARKYRPFKYARIRKAQ